MFFWRVRFSHKKTEPAKGKQKRKVKRNGPFDKGINPQETNAERYETCKETKGKTYRGPGEIPRIVRQAAAAQSNVVAASVLARKQRRLAGKTMSLIPPFAQVFRFATVCQAVEV